MKDTVITYLKDTYHPRTLLIYGSYVRGDYDEYSDFDCMIIVDKKNKKHDNSVLNGVALDCFIFTAAEALSEDPDLFLPVYNAELVIDDGTGKALQERVRKYVQEHEKTDQNEKELIVSWIRKTINRMQKDDDEGNYRAAALLWESLADYFVLRDKFFFGSKEAILDLKQHDAQGYALYHQAITLKSNETIEAWARHVINY